jgi:phosphoribosylglycinamide formyltransferase-1
MPGREVDQPIKLAVLVSGAGRTLQNLLDQIQAGTLPARVSVVIGSRAGLGGLQKATAAHIPTCAVDRRTFTSVQDFSKQIFALCDEAGVDLVCLAGWLCLLDVPERYRDRVMNIHPALLPGFGGKGMFGQHVHETVLRAGMKISGCTVHFVDNDYDAGPIILQRVCPVLDDDTPETLAARVFEEEKIAYPQAIRLFAQGWLRVESGRVRVDADRK